jgi:hypothetical protein
MKVLTCVYYVMFTDVKYVMKYGLFHNYVGTNSLSEDTMKVGLRK